MKNKKFLTNTILNFSILFLIINLFFFEKLNFERLNFLFSYKALEVLILMLFSRLFAPILFTFIFNILLKEKSFFKIIDIYIKGHLVNEAIPGLGYFYRYKKSKSKFGISILEYGSIQTLNNLFIFLSIIILAFFLGFMKIDSTTFYYIFTIGILLLILICVIFIKYKNLFFYFQKIKKISHEFLIIKKKFFKNYYKFIIIFFFYFLQSLFQCYIFYRVTLLFGFELGFIYSSYLYISSILITFFFFLNFIGIFEIVLSFTSYLFVNNYADMIFVGFGFRIIGIIALLIIISGFYILNFLEKNT
jgi:hypothetical protein